MRPARELFFFWHVFPISNTGFLFFLHPFTSFHILECEVLLRGTQVDKMASDEIVWQIINQQFCAFKLK